MNSRPWVQFSSKPDIGLIWFKPFVSRQGSSANPSFETAWWFGTCFFSHSVGNDNPNWLTQIFQRGGIPPTVKIYTYLLGHKLSEVSKIRLFTCLLTYLLASLPSGNQTWQWKMDHLFVIFHSTSTDKRFSIAMFDYQRVILDLPNTLQLCKPPRRGLPHREGRPGALDQRSLALASHEHIWFDAYVY